MVMKDSEVAIGFLYTLTQNSAILKPIKKQCQPKWQRESLH